MNRKMLSMEFKDIMKKVLLFTLFIVFAMDCLAQTFICTDVQVVGKGISTKDIYEQKKKILGTEVKLEIYDNSLRLSYKEGRNVDSDIYDMVRENEYQLPEELSQYRKVIKLQKANAIVNAFTFESYLGNQLQATFVYKRKKSNE